MVQAFCRVPTHVQEAIRWYHKLPPLQGRLVWTHRPIRTRGIAVCPNNNTVLTTQAQSVLVWSADGTFQGMWSALGYASNLFGVCVTPDGTVVVSDCDQHCLHVLTPAGTFVRTLGSEGTAGGQFFHPMGVAATKTGHVLVADYGNQRVQMIRVSDGAFVRQWEPLVFYPTAVCITADQHILVVENASCRVHMFTMESAFVRRWGVRGSDPRLLYCPSGIAVRGHEVLVSDSGTNQILVFRLDGTLVRAWTMGDDNRGFYPETVVAVTRQGHVWVAHYGHSCLQRFE